VTTNVTTYIVRVGDLYLADARGGAAKLIPQRNEAVHFPTVMAAKVFVAAGAPLLFRRPLQFVACSLAATSESPAPCADAKAPGVGIAISELTAAQPAWALKRAETWRRVLAIRNSSRNRDGSHGGVRQNQWN
jgi:hypothetical protein